ncbi:YdeI/OmpD-associated family protein [Hymenobacter koreensis]|uniref:YdeI/OmpD-associated family protein n=1 Tax=Hymenobacter koreensis TaxID=1084523 RepID=A0ABP8J548_9BACT
MPRVIDQYASYHPLSRAEWRQWLAHNHASEPGIWLIYNKKASGQPSVSYAEAVEEALCFGWIDSLPRKLDADRTMLLFTPRKPRSVWSKVNKQRIEQLVQAGLMTPAGQAKIDLAKQNGSWNTLDSSDNLIVPPELEKALAEVPAAKQGFEAFSPSVKKNLLYRLDSAKQPETKAKRIAEIIAQAVESKKMKR